MTQERGEGRVPLVGEEEGCRASVPSAVPPVGVLSVAAERVCIMSCKCRQLLVNVNPGKGNEGRVSELFTQRI